MKSPVVKTHPLMEILSKRLFGLESIPKEHQRRYINKAIKEAVKYHDEILENYKETLLENKEWSKEKLNKFGDDSSIGKCSMSRIHLIDDLLKEL